MATISYVVNAIDNASGTFRKIAGSADGLQSQLDALNKKFTATVALDGAEKAKFELGDLGIKLARLNTRVTPQINSDQITRALIQTAALNLALDRLTTKRKIGTDSGPGGLRGILGRLPGAGGGGILGSLGGIPGISGLLGAGAGGGAGLGGTGVTGLGALGGAGGGLGALAAAAAAVFLIANAAAAAASVITFGLGGAITALGVSAALKIPAVAKAFHSLGQQASTDLASIGTAFEQPLKNIALAAQSQLPGIMLALGDAMRRISGPFSSFGVTLVQAFGDTAVQNSIRAVGTAMGKLLTAFTPAIKPIVDSIATGITNMAKAVRDNPGIFVGFVKVVGEMVGGVFSLLGVLTRFAGWMDRNIKPLWQGFLNSFADPWNSAFTKTMPNSTRIWNDTVKIIFLGLVLAAARTVGGIVGWFAKLPGPLGAPFRLAKRPIDDALAAIEKSVSNSIKRLQHDLDSLHGHPVSVLVSGSGRWALGAAGNLAGGGLTGILTKHAAGGLIPGTGSSDSYAALLTPGEVVVPKGLVAAGAVNHLRGLLPGFAAGGIVPAYHGNVPGLGPWAVGNANVTAGQIVSSIANAMAHAFASSIASFIDTGARSGSAAIAQSFAASVLPRGWSFPALLSLWNQESGWNAFAVNPFSGAYGIPQSLGHGHPYNLGDYKAQILWGISYIAGQYGNSQGAWAHEQAFNWYDRGGWLPAGLSLAMNATGRPERVLGPGEGGSVHVTVNVPPTVNPKEAGRQIAQLILAHTKAGGRLYPAGVSPR